MKNSGKVTWKERKKSTWFWMNFSTSVSFQSLLTARVITRYAITCLKTFKPPLGFGRNFMYEKFEKVQNRWRFFLEHLCNDPFWAISNTKYEPSIIMGHHIDLCNRCPHSFLSQLKFANEHITLKFVSQKPFCVWSESKSKVKDYWNEESGRRHWN